MLLAFAEEAAAKGVRLNGGQLDQLERYVDLLIEWSSRVNLVGNAERDVIVQRHISESIALGAALRERELMRPDTRVVDVGAGAGFPGIPMKIAWPSLHLTTFDATAKKTAFLSAVVDALELSEVAVITGRAEELAHDTSLRESFDLVLARAVAPLPVLVELALPFARVGGRLVTPKGSRAVSEVEASTRALELLGGRAFVVPFAVDGPPQWLVAVLKTRATPSEYPRRSGVPRKSPL